MVEEIKLEMIEYFKDDIKQIDHALKVHGFASMIAGLEKVPAGKRMSTELAAILHDIGIEEAERKHNSREGRLQEIEGPPIAREILLRCGVSEEMSDRVCFIVGNHHTYHKIDDVDFRIVVESDFIVNLSEGNLRNPDIDEIKVSYFTTTIGKNILDRMYLKAR